MKTVARILSLLLLCSCLIGCGEETAAEPNATNAPVTEAIEITVTEPETTAAPITEPETTTAPTDGPHTHNFEISACLEPALCSCGVQATIPGHDYVDGICTRCDAPRQAEEATPDSGYVWIPTKGGTKYHLTQTCSNMLDPAHVTLTEATTQGFTPCKKCYGG